MSKEKIQIIKKSEIQECWRCKGSDKFCSTCKGTGKYEKTNYFMIYNGMGFQADTLK